MEHVYFISQPRTGRIKIGFTRNLNIRLTSIASHSPDEVLLLANIEGGRPQAIHHELRSFCLRGEWFRDCAEVRSFIDLILRDGPERGFGFVGPRSEKGKNRDRIRPHLFGQIAKLVWRKADAEIAAIAGVSDRAARDYLAGRVAAPAIVIAALIVEITRRP